MISHHSILKEELKKITNNINKKYAVLRKQIAKTTEVFENSNIPIFPYEVCFGLFKVLAETESVQSTLSFFPFFQNIINLGFANEDMSRQILTLLTQLKSLPKFQGYENESKMQFLILSLISKTSVKCSRLNFSHSLINVLMSLDNGHNKALWVKTVSALYQIIALCLNSYEDDPSPVNEQAMTIFLADIFTMTKNQAPKWYIEEVDPFCICFCLNELIDTNYVFNFKPIFIATFRNVMVPFRRLLPKVFEKNQVGKHWQLTGYNKMGIILKMVCKFSRIFLDGFEIVEQLVKILSEKMSSAWKILAYEAVDYLFTDSVWMQALLKSNFAELFNFLLTTQFNTIKYVFADKQKIDMAVSEQDSARLFTTNGIDWNGCEVSGGMEAKMIIKNIDQISSSLYAIYKDEIVRRTNGLKIEEDPPLFKTYKFCQKTIFEIIKTVIGKEMCEETLQSILKTAQRYIHLSGSFSDYTASTMYMKLLCKYCLPNEFSLIGYRHVQINKMILNTANCLGSLFNTACWVIVWKALENYSLYYNKYLLAKQQYHSERETDVQILYKTMDSIFTESPKYNDKYILNIIDSLIEVTYECLENNYSEQSKKLFSFERIQQIYKLNLHRVSLIWPPLSSSLLCITTSKVSYFRISALNLLNALIPLSLYHLSNHPESLTLSLTSDNYENIILEPWSNLVKCQFQELKTELIVAVNKIIIDYGHILTHGWKSILHVVSEMSDLKSLQSIVETFLDKMDSHIMEILLIVDSIERKLQDTNQKYLCLTMIWAIGDHAHKNNHAKVLRKIYGILLQPDEMFNLGTEARHSSFYIFAELIVHNSLENSPQFWQEVFDEIQAFCSYGVTRSLQSDDKKLAEEAIKNILTNLVKICRIFFMVSEQWEERQLVLKELSWFYKLCGSVLKFRQNEIYQCLTKQMKQILFSKTDESLVQQQILTFLEAITEAYYVDPNTKILKCLITYLPVDIYEIVFKCLPLVKKNFTILYKLIEKIFLLRLEAEEKDIKLAQARIFFQERLFNQFFKKFHSAIISQYPQILSQYLEKVVKTLHCLLLYEDYTYLSKMFQYPISIVTHDHSTSPETLLDLLSKIMSLKYDQRWISDHGASKEVPIWYIASQELFKISYELVSRKSRFSRKAYSIFLQMVTHKIKGNLISNKDKSVLKKCSIQCISFYHENFISISKFLVEHYFYNEELQDLFIMNEPTLVSVGQSIFEETLLFQEKDPTNPCKSALDLIFKLSHKLDQNYTQFLKQRQSIILQLLMQRIQNTFQSFFKQDNHHQQNNLQELKFILKKMQTLDLADGVLLTLTPYLISHYHYPIKSPLKILDNSKGHLFYFANYLTRLIKSKDQQLRNQVSNIYDQTNAILFNII